MKKNKIKEVECLKLNGKYCKSKDNLAKPEIYVNLITHVVNYQDMKGKDFKKGLIYGGCEVLFADNGLDIDTDGLTKDLENAINAVIRKRVKISVEPRGTSFKYMTD